MIYQKPNNYGIDSKLLEIQKHLDSKLASKWKGIINIYGRIERLTNGVEVFVKNTEYKNPFFDDKVSASIAFDVTGYDTTTNLKADVNLIVTVRLDKIYDNNNRDDQKSLLEVHKLLKYAGVLDIDGMQTGLDVVKDLGIEIKHREMQPWFVFSISFKTVFVNNSCK